MQSDEFRASRLSFISLSPSAKSESPAARIRARGSGKSVSCELLLRDRRGGGVLFDARLFADFLRVLLGCLHGRFRLGGGGATGGRRIGLAGGLVGGKHGHGSDREGDC